MANEFRGDYHPGGATTRYKRRAWARKNGQKGGFASGRKRRELATGRRPARRRTRQEAICLNYRHRQLNRQAFAELYRKVRPAGNSAGLETAWQHYQGIFTRYRAEGQHYRTTNDQRSKALKARGRERGRRQVQRLNRLMAEMGLAQVSHFRDRRDLPGHKDCLVVEIRTVSKNVTPSPKGERLNPPYGREVQSLSPRKVEKGTAEDESIPPPPAADDIGAPSGAERPATEEERIESEIRFAQMKLDAGFATGPARHRLHALQAELRHLRQANPGSGSAPAQRRGSACERRPG